MHTVYSPRTANIPTAVADPTTLWLLFTTQTAQHLCHHHVSSSSLGCCCMKHFDTSKPFCFYSGEITGGLSHSCFNALREIGIKAVWNTLLLFLLSATTTDLAAPAIHRTSKYLKSHYRLTSSTLYDHKWSIFFLRWLKQKRIDINFQYSTVLFIQQSRSACSITAQYLVPSDGLTEVHFF